MWKQIPSTMGMYEASNKGEIRSVSRTDYRGRKIKGKILSQCWTWNRLYKRVIISINGNVKNVSVHRLVAEAWIKNPLNKPQVNHKNGIKTDNNVKNLEWCTAAENLRHKYQVLGHKPTKYWLGKRNHRETKYVELVCDLCGGKYMKKSREAKSCSKRYSAKLCSTECRNKYLVTVVTASRVLRCDIAATFKRVQKQLAKEPSEVQA